MGRSTCASASALSLDAQPAQLDRLVSRICFPEGCRASFSIGVLYTGSICFLSEISFITHCSFALEGSSSKPPVKPHLILHKFCEAMDVNHKEETRNFDINSVPPLAVPVVPFKSPQRAAEETASLVIKLTCLKTILVLSMPIFPILSKTFLQEFGESIRLKLQAVGSC